MWQALSSFGGAALGGIASIFGQRSANQANMRLQKEANQFSAHQAQQQMDFQAEMSSTAYQRSMLDMKAAGLNPMLAFSQGGASSPGGAMGSVQAASVENEMSPAVASAIDALRLKKEIRGVDSQIGLNDASAKMQNAQADLAKTNAKAAEKSMQQTAKQIEALDAQMPAIKSKAKFESSQADYDSRMLQYDNFMRRTGQLTGVINDAKSAITPWGGGGGRTHEYHIDKKTGEVLNEFRYRNKRP
ncbi:DNA pilot protein [Flyfo microvirus Tbat2_160]|nr:DNA pilot protein [Flyfo microvirus Tbat2_160]